MKQQQFTVISIEDNLPDFELLKQALNAVNDLSINLINIQNGQTALNYLLKKKGYENAPTPDLIILDINLPQIGGLEILNTIKKDENLKSIPVIVFSTSDAMRDIRKSYILNANTYITKTFDIKELFDKVKIVADYWFKTAELPYSCDFCIIERQDKKID
jgi:two-component system, chemotaxis family, response regulator Rcp1